jgi:phosphatidylglycerophosphate synthase
MLDTRGRKYVQPLLSKIADGFIKIGFTANGVTVLAFVIGLVAACLVVLGWLIPAVIVLWISGILDAVDGTISRKLGTSSPLGTLMDVVFDRIVEIGILMALIFIQPELAVYVAIVNATIIITMVVFLTVGATAQVKTEKTFYYQAGVAERTEGFIMLSLGILLENHRHIVLIIFASLILFTAVQRFVEAVKLLKD